MCIDSFSFNSVGISSIVRLPYARNLSLIALGQFAFKYVSKKSTERFIAMVKLAVMSWSSAE